MVMIPMTDAGAFLAGDRSEAAEAYAANKAALQSEIMERVQEWSIPDQTTYPVAHAVTASAQGVLIEICSQVENPCVFRAGPNIDPWEERLKHVRSLAELVPASLVESGQAGMDANDPRREKLHIVADRIGNLVSETLEAAIETVIARHAPSIAPPTTPRM